MATKKVLVGSEDRISSLPDDVLCHILSFLPTKFSVITRILSTRWKQLFTFVPNLEFRYNSFLRSSSTTSFIHFVNSVFIFYQVPRMNIFRLSFAHDGEHPDHFPIFSWISAAIQRHVQEIHIRIPCSCFGPLALPIDTFSCKTLKELTLKGRFNVVLPHSVCLPCLWSCVFIYVSFEDESADRLFQNCPALERITLASCYLGEDVDVLRISGPSLKYLNIHESGDIFQLVLNVPNLRNFEYAGSAANKFLGLESLKSVVDASICYEQELSNSDDVVVELVHSISLVQQLYLNCDVMEAFICSSHSLPKFNNLTRMKFGPFSKLIVEVITRPFGQRTST